jgi:hypothetical protein
MFVKIFPNNNKYVIVNLFLSNLHHKIHEDLVTVQDEMVHCEEFFQYFFKQYGWAYYPSSKMDLNELYFFECEKKIRMTILKNDVIILVS